MDRPTSIQVYTYADLRRCHTERLQAEQKSPQQIWNHVSALTQFAKAIGRTDASECEHDFSGRIDTVLSVFQENLRAKGISDAAIANSVSYVRSIKSTFNAMQTGIAEGNSFTDALRALAQSRNIPIRQLCRDTGIAHRTMLDWLSGAIPRRTRDIVKIERYFELPSGTLSSKIDFGVAKSTMALLKSRESANALKRDAYLYKNVSEKVRSEWSGLLHFYTAPYLLNKMQRNSTWRVKPVELVGSAHLIQWSSTTPNGVCPTAQIVWGYVSGFLGYLIREKALGGAEMRDEQLSLALLSDASLVLAYIEFRRNRNGAYTESINKLLIFAIALLRKDTGFLRQQPVFGASLLEPVAGSDWDAWCDKNRDVLDSVYRDLKKGQHIKRGRDPKEPIATILAEEHPIHTLIRMADTMSERFILDQCTIMRATGKRDVLLVKMLISNPLRVHHYSIMTYRKDNTGNLYQDSYGAWRLRFAPSDFKNQKGAASKEYDVMLSPWLYVDIEEYLNIYRPTMKYASETDRVFMQNSKYGTRNYWDTSMISTRLLNLTRHYIPDCPGFGPHAFRHIIATDYIKNNPNGYQVAANILHDKLETVLREYAHVKVADGFAHWTTYLGEQLKAVGKVNNE